MTDTNYVEPDILDKSRLEPFCIKRAMAGETVVTRAGWPVRFVCWDRKAKDGWASFVALVTVDTGQHHLPIYWDDGRIQYSDGQNPYDLFMYKPIAGKLPFDLQKAKEGAKLISKWDNDVRIVSFDSGDPEWPLVCLSLDKHNGTESPFFCNLAGEVVRPDGSGNPEKYVFIAGEPKRP